ncbi:MAG: arylsulfotransferase family protein [Solirubrobacterales bacterium]|nr:arylsulfotransferase family protein [Solirubrobacterales bacterium]
MSVRPLIIPVCLALLAGLVVIPGTAQGKGERGGPKPVTVFPSPGTPVASDSTTFSFRGLKPGDLGPVTIRGSRTGYHRGRRLAHSDGHGVSVIPERGFMPGELVSVFTGKRIRGARGGDFRVRIGRFTSDGRKRSRPKEPNGFPRLKSRPDLRPPALKVLTSDPAAAPGRVLFAPKQTGLVICDRLGRITWFRPTGFGGRGQEVQDFKVQRYRGSPVLTYWRGDAGRNGPFQVGSYNILDRRYRDVARFGTGNGYRPDAHEFTITSKNTALAIAYRSVRWDLRKHGGGRQGKVFDNVVQEIDIKTGAVLFEWHSLGNVGLDASVSRRPKNGDTWDYFHANSVAEDGDSLLVSARKVSTIYRIARKSGRIKWRLRGDGRKPRANDFRVGPEARFGFQHDAERLPNGDISLFDNGSARSLSTVVRNQSSALVLRPRSSGEMSEVIPVGRFEHPQPIIAGSQGSTEVLPGGNVFVGWGSRSRITEFAPDGGVVFDAVFSAPVNSYRATKADWTGRPVSRPAMASKRGKRGATVWASWNGRDDIVYWRVLTGPGRKRLDPLTASFWTGLETAIPAERLGAWVRVQAFSGEGTLLGQSKVARVGTRVGGRLRR